MSLVSMDAVAVQEQDPVGPKYWEERAKQPGAFPADPSSLDMNDPRSAELIIEADARVLAATLRVIRVYGGNSVDVLDNGCGPGIFTIALAVAGHHVTAVDWSHTMLTRVRFLVRGNMVEDRVEIVKGNSLKLVPTKPGEGLKGYKLRPGIFGVVLDARHLIHQISKEHLTNPLSFDETRWMNAVRQDMLLTKPGGILVIVEPLRDFNPHYAELPEGKKKHGRTWIHTLDDYNYAVGTKWGDPVLVEPINYINETYTILVYRAPNDWNPFSGG